MSLLVDKTVVEGWENEHNQEKEEAARKIVVRGWVCVTTVINVWQQCARLSHELELLSVILTIGKLWLWEYAHMESASSSCPSTISHATASCNFITHLPLPFIHAVFLFHAVPFFPQVAWIFGTLPETLPYELTPPPPGWDNFLCHSRRLAASRTSCSATSVSSLSRRCESKLHSN